MDAEERTRLRQRATYAARAARKMDYRAREVDVWTLADDAIALLDALDAAEKRIAALTEESFQRSLAIDLGEECGGEWGVNTLCEIMATLGYPQTLLEAVQRIERGDDADAKLTRAAVRQARLETLVEDALVCTCDGATDVVLADKLRAVLTGDDAPSLPPKSPQSSGT